MTLAVDLVDLRRGDRGVHFGRCQTKVAVIGNVLNNLVVD